MLIKWERVTSFCSRHGIVCVFSPVFSSLLSAICSPRFACADTFNCAKVRFILVLRCWWLAPENMAVPTKLNSYLWPKIASRWSISPFSLTKGLYEHSEKMFFFQKRRYSLRKLYFDIKWVNGNCFWLKCVSSRGLKEKKRINEQTMFLPF